MYNFNTLFIILQNSTIRYTFYIFIYKFTGTSYCIYILYANITCYITDENLFLFRYAHKVGAKIIDITATVTAVHQKTHGMNKTVSRCNEEEVFRKNVLPRVPIHLGNIDCAPYETRIDMKGNVFIIRKHFELYKKIYCKEVYYDQG